VPPLHFAVQNGDFEMVKLLIEKGFDLKRWSKIGTPVYIAGINNNKEILEFLISKKADINGAGPKGKSLMHYAAANGDIEMMKYLVSKKADDKFIVVRLVSWNAIHDMGMSGIPNRTRMIEELQKYAKVIITS
jgi:ankyrin repeat protein